MYLHIGRETIVSEKNLIGIFDLDNTSVSKFTREFLRSRQQQGAVITVAEDIPKSFVVCAQPTEHSPKPMERKALSKGSASSSASCVPKKNILPVRETVYLSQLAASTLRRRAGQSATMED